MKTALIVLCSDKRKQLKNHRLLTMGSCVRNGSKPPYSYVALIALAIRSSPNMCSTLADIYRFIENQYPYYRNSNQGWRNSIRHNLSMNECFVRIASNKAGLTKKEIYEINKGSVNSGSYWTLHPDSLSMFDDGGFLRRRQRFRIHSSPTNEMPHHTPFEMRAKDGQNSLDRVINEQAIAQPQGLHFSISDYGVVPYGEMPLYSFYTSQLTNSLRRELASHLSY
uniref:Fork-head domain-containing protein n=1 Tax=Ascaris lumbricoides TaxID=6252 RepID=A0A0M3HVA1_ASCLU